MCMHVLIHSTHCYWHYSTNSIINSIFLSRGSWYQISLYKFKDIIYTWSQPKTHPSHQMRNSTRSPKSDYSQSGLSKLTIPKWEIYSLQRQIKQIKYPTYSISNAENLTTKIQSFKDENIRNELKKELVHVNSLRKVRGDGNCFFRALAFCELARATGASVKVCFPELGEVSLACCFPESIPADFRNFYQHSFLRGMLEKQWEPLYSKLLEQSNQNSRKALIKVFDEYPYLDFIVVLYFRALCLKGLWKYEQQLKQFLLGKQQEYIRTYSEETEGVSINICSMMVKVVIRVYEIRKGVVKTYVYDNVDKKKGEISLLFSDNHYDILQKNQQIEAQQNSLTQSAYYSDVDKKMTSGTCLECGLDKMVFKDSAICYRCFDKIEQVAKRYDGGRLKRARCQDCLFIREDVLEDLGLCKRCIEKQNRAEERSRQEELEKARLKSKKKEEKEEKEPEKQQAPPETPKQQKKKTRGKCIQCYYFQYLDVETGMCEVCTTQQKRLMSRVELRQQQDKKRRESNQKIKATTKPEPDKIAPMDQYYEKKYALKPLPIVSPGKQRPAEDIKKKDTDICKKSEFDSNLETCSSCKTKGILEQQTKLCSKCFKQQFSEHGDCVKCKFRNLVHEDSRKCKQCHVLFPSSMPRTQVNERGSSIRKKCMKCVIYPAEYENLCSRCYRNCYCTGCKKISLTAFLIGGRCPRCR